MRVLIVDDSRDATTIVSRLLAHYGHEVREADRGLLAVAIAAQFLPEVVFLDIYLPGMDGYEIARRIRQLAGCEGARIVAYTGTNPDPARDQAAGIDVRLLKPASIDQMLAAMSAPRPTTNPRPQ